MTDFEKIISFESLYKAHRRARLGKRHKKEVILFEANLSENLWALHYDLKYEKYKMGNYHTFKIYDPKEREIQAIDYRDRIVQHSLCDNYLIPLFEKHLIYDNGACRKNKGTGFIIKRLRKFLVAHNKKYGNSGYFVKIDVSKYFNSVDHDILKEKLKPLIKEEKIFKLISKILDSYNFVENKGLPMGNQSSQCFALFYLDCLDRYFKENLKIEHYIRYMDDILAIVPTKKLAQNSLFSAKEQLEKNKLKINPKSQIIKISKGVKFLGWRFFLLPSGKLIQKLSHDTKKRIVNKVKTCKYYVKVKKRTIKHFKCSLISYKGFLQRANAHYFFCKLKNFYN